MIRLQNLERRYPLAHGKFFYVLRDINIDVAAGEFVSVMGPSGAGKSTLLHILGMHDHGWSGEYFLNETAVHHLKPKERASLRNEQIGFVFQQYHLLDDLTVYENLDIPLSYRKVGRNERAAMVADTLDRFQIVAKRDLYPRQLLRRPATTSRCCPRDHCQPEADSGRRAHRESALESGRRNYAALSKAKHRGHDHRASHALGEKRVLRQSHHSTSRRLGSER